MTIAVYARHRQGSAAKWRAAEKRQRELLAKASKLEHAARALRALAETMRQMHDVGLRQAQRGRG
jgi:hypothetical protein